jgi:hypothetical protein
MKIIKLFCSVLCSCMLITAYADIISPTCPADQAPACNNKEIPRCVLVSDPTQKTNIKPTCRKSNAKCVKLASSKQFVPICK